MLRLIPLVGATLVAAVLSLGAEAPAGAATYPLDGPSHGTFAGVVAGPAPAARARRTALFFGDSYFVGGGCSPDRTRDMAAIAGRRLGYRPVVRGAGGTGFVAANPDYGIPPYLEQIAQGALDVPSAALVVIEGGSNDYGYPVTKIRHNAKKILAIARSKYPDALVILAGPMQTYGDFSISDPIKKALRGLARKVGVPFVNMQKWTYGHDELLCSDYAHTTYAGHVVIGQRLAEALAKRGA